MQVPTHAILIAAFAMQGTNAAYEAGKTFLEYSVPPPIEGTGVGPDRVIAGSTAFVNWQIIKRTDCEGKNSRVWDGEDGFHITEAEKATALPTSDTVRTYSIPTEIPSLAPEGELALTIKGYYDCPNSARSYFTLGPVKMNIVREDT